MLGRLWVELDDGHVCLSVRVAQAVDSLGSGGGDQHRAGPWGPVQADVGHVQLEGARRTQGVRLG